MAILGGRRFALHGIRPGDLVLVTYALGLSNGGMAPREALWRYTGAIEMAGSGTEESSAGYQLSDVVATLRNTSGSAPV